MVDALDSSLIAAWSQLRTPVVHWDARLTHVPIALRPGARAIEEEDFPFESFSDVAELESWRKEINRPLSHIHKWWAQRLGSVFRAILLGAFASKGSDILSLFYSAARVHEAVVFDPFMGSGTTLTEAVKLGARVIGNDINPVAYFLVKNALAAHDRQAILQAFEDIKKDIASGIRSFYRTTLPDGRLADVLYYFWVKTIPCPSCQASVDLFSSYVFARHAYASRYPKAHAVCPHCGGINTVSFNANAVTCSACCQLFDPSDGPVHGQKATCPRCEHTFSVAKTVRALGTPPSHRPYAKLVLTPNGQKEYFAITDYDLQLYAKAEQQLRTRENSYPVVRITPGYNTDQALSYNYEYWHEFFNARQLLCLSILAERIKGIRERALRDLFVCLFSGVLEFNNMFASFKGEGTGAVRHMFAHHILKPERTPLEANVWGTPKSSGSFSTLFESRILRALDYASNPFEIHVRKASGKNYSEKTFGLSEPIGFDHANTFEEFEAGKHVYLSCRDSSQTDLAKVSVDAVITDPPFFDNVHYSQLADFFYVWQRHILGATGNWEAVTTRSDSEVQHGEVKAFTERLTAVWAECHRVLKDDGLLVFTYHHSRNEGWRSVLRAVMDARFGVVAVHPMKAEMSVAMPKLQAKEPIDLDVVIVCRKIDTLNVQHPNFDWLRAVTTTAANQVMRLRNADRILSRNDIRIIVMSQSLRHLSLVSSVDTALALLDAKSGETEKLIDKLHRMEGHSV